MRPIGGMMCAAALIAAAQPGRAASDAATRFGAREDVAQISLSPDGNRVAFIEPTAGRGSVVMIATLADGTIRPIMRSSGNPDRLRYCRWSTDTRLVCGVFLIVATGDGNLSFDRLVAVDADGRNLKVLSARSPDRAIGFAQGGGGIIDWLTDRSGAVLMTRMHVAQETTGSHLGSDRQGLGIDRVDTASLSRTTVEQPREDADGYLSDGHGNVRIMGIQGHNDSGYLAERTSYFYRKPDSRGWSALSADFEPAAVDPGKNLAYGFATRNGRQALYSVALDGSLKRDLVFARDDVDVDELIQIGRQARPVGVSFATERRQTVFFDPELKALSVSLSKAIPGLPLVSFVDASADESKLLLFAGSDVDPGRFYLYDKTTRHLAEVLPMRPQLANTALAPVKAITFKAADGTSIPAYLTLPAGSDGKGLPAIVMPHGGPASRDEWGFDWFAQFFANRGYAVLQPNYRGSTGYGEAWFQKNGWQGWRTAIGDVNDGGRWLVSQGIAKPDRLAIVGWSYGGYAALQTAVLDPALFKAIVAVAPVTDLDTLREEHRDFTDFQIVDAMIGHGEHVQSGSPAHNAARIAAPVLLFHGDLDQNVGIGESRLMASRLKAAGKKVELVELHGLDHQLEDDGVRAAMLDRADAFLRASMGM